MHVVVLDGDAINVIKTIEFSQKDFSHEGDLFVEAQELLTAGHCVFYPYHFFYVLVGD